MESKESEKLNNICNFCETNLKRYTCPRCNADYCSLICYQSATHVQCAEFFYQKCVLEDIASTAANDDHLKEKTVEALSRLRADTEINCASQSDEDSIVDSDDDNMECLGLSDRLAGVNLDDTAKVWEKLTADERQQFKALLRSGDISKFVPQWQPWWLQQDDVKIQEVEKIANYKKNCPEIKKNIKHFATITKKVPAACVQYNLVNIICAYAFTVRYFNGCHFEFLEEAVNCLMLLSLCLKTNQNFQNNDSAMESVHQECVKTELIIADLENVNCMIEDTKMILRGPRETEKKFYVLCALSDLHKLLQSLLKRKNIKITRFVAHNLQKDKIKLCLRKIEYFLSYTLSYYGE